MSVDPPSTFAKVKVPPCPCVKQRNLFLVSDDEPVVESIANVNEA